MSRQIICLRLIALLALCGFGPGVDGREEPNLPSFEAWKAACESLPANTVLQGRIPSKALLPLKRYADLQNVVSRFLDLAVHGDLAQATNWLGGLPERGFFDTNRAHFSSRPPNAIPFQPFAQKLSLPAQSEVFFRGDLHGDIHSLLVDLSWLNEQKYLTGFKIQRPDFFMVFLGDYSDRGMYGIEVLYTILRLKIENPDRVFLGRGNHEELSLQTRYGFVAEGRGKYGNEFEPTKLFRLYDFLPAVMYVGTGESFVQCNHGGMEPGYSPAALLDSEGPLRFQLLGKLNQKTFLAAHPTWLANDENRSRDAAKRALQDFVPEDPINPSVLGFMWNDFAVLASEPQFAIDPGRAFVYGEKATQFILAQSSGNRGKVLAVFRAHQHSPVLNPMMRRLVASGGVFRHWQASDSAALANRPVAELAQKLETAELRPIPANSVWTFNVSPDTVYGEGCGYSFDAFGLLKLAPTFADWRLRRVNLPVKP